MGQFSKVPWLLTMHTTPQRDLHCGPGLGGLNQVYGPNRHIHKTKNLFLLSGDSTKTISLQ